jgi:N-6 DNA Methylase
MRTRATSTFTSITTEGALLPADLLRRIAAGDKSVDGLSEASYHLTEGEKLGEAISRSWTRLTGAWAALRTARGRLPESDLGTTLTRDRWLLPLFQELGYGRLGVARGLGIDGVNYPVSHLWQNVPIHLVSFRTDLDTRTSGVAGAARRSPHSLVQEFLNKSDDHLWGFVSNGLTLRILRDNASLTRQAYVEFDLVAMFDGDVYSDFTVLWLLAHQSRVEAEKPVDFRLESWSKLAREQGVRALDQLRVGVEHAIQALGSGFLAHPANSALKERLRSGTLDKQDYYRQLLRLVYRFLFLFVAEDRDVLLVPETSSGAKATYRNYYSTARLRQLAVRRRGTRHGDLWEGLRLVMEFLGRDDGCPSLGLPALGSSLFSADAIADLAGCALANRDILTAIRELSVTDERGIRRQVDFRNLRSEELGSVYEALLEQHPEIHADSATFELRTAAGHERKTTGSYYTPDSLVQCLLDSALEPVLAEAVRKTDPEKAILDLKVCDPACGSGHFLVAAAHRIAKRLAAVRTGDEEPSPEATRHALRDVIGRCIYGVDLNPMAVELCKVALWMEAIEPGRPLSFLEHHIQGGNSLLGTTPALLEKGIPDEAFEPLTGDDRKFCSALKKRNRKEREGFMSLPFVAEPHSPYLSVRSRLEAIGVLDDATINGIRAKEQRWHEMASSVEYGKTKLAADAWCAAFVWPKHPDAPPAITHELFEFLRHDPERIPAESLRTVVRLAEEYQFLHWHVAFPDVFQTNGDAQAGEHDPNDWNGGFDVVLGNPPWERVKLQDKEWFAQRSPSIANAPNAAARKRLIDALKIGNPALYQQFLDDSRNAEGEGHLMRNSGRYPLCGRGDINVYTVFAEGMRTLLNDRGRVGCVLPTGIATDDTTKFFFQDVVEKKSLASLFDFENKGIFPGVHSSYKFCLFTSGRGVRPTTAAAEFVFFARAVEDLRDLEHRFTLSAKDIGLLNPNTRTCPIFRSRRDAELTKAIYRRVPVLIREARDSRSEENIWDIRFSTMFHMSNDSHLFRTREQLEADGWRLVGNIFRKDSAEYLPLYEAKMVDFFDHRAADVRVSEQALQRKAQPATISSTDKRDPFRAAQPQYWITKADWLAALPSGVSGSWMLGFASVTSPTNERTFCPSLVPASGAGNSFPLMFGKTEAGHLSLLLSCTSSFAFDYAARQKVGGVNLNFFLVQQFPVLAPFAFANSCLWDDNTPTLREWLLPRVLELTYTAWDLEPFAKDCGWSGPPFRWDEERRFLLRCELDAAFFHLYLLADKRGDWHPAEGETAEDLALLKASFPTPRHAVGYIMDTFPIVRRRDEEKYDGDFRTKRVILEIYDEMAEAIRTGQPYQTRLDPPPADPMCCHPPNEDKTVSSDEG